MFGKRNLFKVDISGLEFWQRTQLSESSEFLEVYRKVECTKCALILDKIGNPKSMPKNSGCYYMDLVTGRVVSVDELDDDNLVIYPSGIVISRNKFMKYNGNAYSDAAKILDDAERLEEYTKLSEEILYDSYFCEEIANRDNLVEVPATMVEEAIVQKRNSRPINDVHKLKKSRKASVE